MSQSQEGRFHTIVQINIYYACTYTFVGIHIEENLNFNNRSNKNNDNNKNSNKVYGIIMLT